MVEKLIGKRISIPGQFTGSVMVESAKVFEDTCLLRVRNQQGELRDAYLTTAEAEEILARAAEAPHSPLRECGDASLLRRETRLQSWLMNASELRSGV